MAIKTTTRILSAVAPSSASDSTIENVWGFAWNVQAGGANGLSRLALLRALVIFEDGSRDELMVRPGVFYRWGRLVAQVRLWSTSALATTTVSLDLALDESDFIGDEPAPAAGYGRQLYSSGVVAAGALIDSGVLDLRDVRELLVLVDNTAGAVLRDLSLLSYLDDGATLVDTAILRRCGFGAAPAGSSYAPGNVRGTIGPNPPGGTTGVHVLYDNTSAANGALDTGILFATDQDALEADAKASGGVTQIGPLSVADDLVTAYNRPGASLAAAAYQAHFWGPGAAVPTGMAATAIATPSAIPRLVRYTTTAAGAGNTVRLRVIGRGRVPGTFAHQMALPARAKLQLAAAGAANARMTIFGR